MKIINRKRIGPLAGCYVLITGRGIQCLLLLTSIRQSQMEGLNSYRLQIHIRSALDLVGNHRVSQDR